MSLSVSLILQKSQRGQLLSRKDALTLLKIPEHSSEYNLLLSVANEYSRQTFSNHGIIFAQIGLDMQPCHVNCKFCSLSQQAQMGKASVVKSLADTVSQAKQLAASGIDDLFLMTTAEFDREVFLDYLRAVRSVIPNEMRLVANTADFDLPYAQAMQRAGATGAYHVCRLREEIDTGVAEERRMKTLDAIREAGLVLYYCVEPIGPEHSAEELADEMLRIRSYPVEVMAVMKRISVPGTPLFDRGEISSSTLAKICAVTTLTTRPPRAMCVHEPDALCLTAGANQLYAECGVNPRDTENETALHRGFSVADARQMLHEAGWNT